MAYLKTYFASTAEFSVVEAKELYYLSSYGTVDSSE